MPPKLAQDSRPNRQTTIETSVRICEPCRRRKTHCNGVKPCTHCLESQIECVYTIMSDLSRSVFTTNTAQRLSSGSACETCRRRKTKCDGGSPCGFCFSAGIECVNNSERRKRPIGIPSMPSQLNVAASRDTVTIDRIEDRLRRIEKLMTAFSSNTNGPLGTTAAVVGPVRQSLGLSLPSSSRRITRQQRHSVQGISVAKEQAELRIAYSLKKKRRGLSPPPSPFRETAAASPYATPPNSGSKKPCSLSDHASSSPPPSFLSPDMRQTSTHPLISSMFSLTLSPSSSTSSTSNNSFTLKLPPSGSHPPMSLSHVAPLTVSTTTGNGTHDVLCPPEPPPQTTQHWGLDENEWINSASSMPSLMDQLSKRTFGNTSPFTFPPYPLSPSRQQSPSTVD